MSDRGTLVVTGASGTVGDVLLRAVASLWPGPLVVVGRRQPNVAVDHLVHTDFTDPKAVEHACTVVAAAQPPVTGLLLAAGVDCRSTMETATDAEFQRAFTVNCLVPLRLLAAAASTSKTGALRVVVISSDVIGMPQSATLVYAATKAALDIGVQHATSDNPRPRALLLRLPYLGTPMVDVHDHRSDADGPPLPVLDRATGAVRDFLLSPTPQDPVRIWTDA